jgi:hypothetical protein
MCVCVWGERERERERGGGKSPAIVAASTAYFPNSFRLPICSAELASLIIDPINLRHATMNSGVPFVRFVSRQKSERHAAGGWVGFALARRSRARDKCRLGVLARLKRAPQDALWIIKRARPDRCRCGASASLDSVLVHHRLLYGRS